MLSLSEPFHCNVMLHLRHLYVPLPISTSTYQNRSISYGLASCFVSQPRLQASQASTAPPGRRNGPRPFQSTSICPEKNTSSVAKTQRQSSAKVGKPAWSRRNLSPLYPFMLVAGFDLDSGLLLSRLSQFSRLFFSLPSTWVGTLLKPYPSR